jgi:hypothetical protein
MCCRTGFQFSGFGFSKLELVAWRFEFEIRIRLGEPVLRLVGTIVQKSCCQRFTLNVIDPNG